MKNTIKTYNFNSAYSIRLVLILFTAILYSCSPSEEESLQPEKVTFSFNVSDIAGGRATADDLPEGTSLLISLVDNAGNTVLTHHEINLLNIGGSYISEPLELAPGRYALSDFMLVNESSTVLYATPQKNAPLAKLVTHSLPYNISVSRNKVANVDMEVIDAQVNSPADLGYASFEINIVHPLRISVFVPTEGGVALTEATARIYDNNGEEVYTYELGAKMNLLSFKGDASTTYKLTINKNYYTRYVRQFTYNELMAELGDKPLDVVLQRPVLFSLSADAETKLGYNASGTLYLDWSTGYGTEQWDLVFDEENAGAEFANQVDLSPREHAEEVPYTSLDIYGDLNIISSVAQNRGEELDLTYLTSLQELSLWNNTSETLDLSHNSQMFRLNFSNLPNLHTLKLGEHRISSVNLDGDIQIVDDLLSKVYNNAIQKNITHGDIYLSTDQVIEDVTRTKLRQLRDEYQWSVIINDEEGL